jgi:hypothetical protein
MSSDTHRMSSDTQDLNVKVERTRRNILKTGFSTGALLGSAGLVGSAVLTRKAHALPCATAVGCRCFLKGTYIQTAEGERKVEELATGDLLPTMFGGIRPIQWIAHYPIKKSDPSKPWPKDARPVRIARSALAPDVPQADLYVTQAHGAFIDGVLVSAGYLVNGTTITLCDMSQSNELEFFHVKLETHDVIYAERAAVETFLNVDESAVNFADYFRMYGVPTSDEARCLPMLANWRPSGLKSRVNSAVSWNDRRRRIAMIRDRLKQRAIALSQELEPSV